MLVHPCRYPSASARRGVGAPGGCGNLEARSTIPSVVGDLGRERWWLTRSRRGAIKNGWAVGFRSLRTEESYRVRGKKAQRPELYHLVRAVVVSKRFSSVAVSMARGNASVVSRGLFMAMV